MSGFGRVVRWIITVISGIACLISFIFLLVGIFGGKWGSQGWSSLIVFLLSTPVLIYSIACLVRDENIISEAISGGDFFSSTGSFFAVVGKGIFIGFKYLFIGLFYVLASPVIGIIALVKLIKDKSQPRNKTKKVKKSKYKAPKEKVKKEYTNEYRGTKAEMYFPIKGFISKYDYTHGCPTAFGYSTTGRVVVCYNWDDYSKCEAANVAIRACHKYNKLVYKFYHTRLGKKILDFRVDRLTKKLKAEAEELKRKRIIKGLPPYQTKEEYDENIKLEQQASQLSEEMDELFEYYKKEILGSKFIKYNGPKGSMITTNDMSDVTFKKYPIERKIFLTLPMSIAAETSRVASQEMTDKNVVKSRVDATYKFLENFINQCFDIGIDFEIKVKEKIYYDTQDKGGHGGYKESSYRMRGGISYEDVLIYDHQYLGDLKWGRQFASYEAKLNAGGYALHKKKH